MSHFPHGAFIAAQQAREQRLREQEEEEAMTRYSTEDLEKNWEFKIVRSESGAFRKPEVFQTLLQEESLAGWELVEKLDNRRVRLKRPREARRRDTSLPTEIDPYRTYYGRPTARNVVMIGVGLMIALVIGLTVVIQSMSGASGSVEAPSLILPMIAGVGILTLLVLMIGFVFLSRRR